MTRTDSQPGSTTQPGGPMGQPGGPMGQPLAKLAAGFAAVPADVMVNDVTLDSRAVAPGGLFLACQGRTHHGLKFAEQAVARGARAVLYEDAPEVAMPKLGAGVFVAAVPQLSQRASLIADRFFGAPSQALTTAGITGTNDERRSANGQSAV